MVRLIIGDGNSTRLWLNPWHHRGLLHDWFPTQLTYNSWCNLKAKAAALIEDNEWSLPEQLKRCAPDMALLIEGTEITGGDDYIIWAPSASGKFTLADFYKFIRKKENSLGSGIGLV